MDGYDQIVEKLRQQGERLTLQRQLVIEALSQTGTHMTIQDVSRYITEKHGAQSLAEPTIYRILQWLKDIGIASQTDMAESGIVYQIIGESRHHHLVCLSCNKIIDIPDHFFDSLRNDLSDEYGFQSRIDHMAIYGLCKVCSSLME